MLFCIVLVHFKPSCYTSVSLILFAGFWIPFFLSPSAGVYFVLRALATSPMVSSLLPITAGVFWRVASRITTLYYASISPIFDTSVPWWLSSPSSPHLSLLPHSSEFPLFQSHLAADLFAKYCLLVTFYCCHLALFDRKSCSWYVVVVCITIQRLG